MTTHRLALSFAVGTLIFGSSLALASDKSAEGIGFYTAMSGLVNVTHPHDAQSVPVKLHDQVLFKDVIQTQGESRTKAFFQDDSMLTVGENSRVEINEYIYNPEQNVRKTVVKLMQGQVRALVSKVFKANGSRFEIHTPSAVAAARGTYFTVWVENEQSGIINIGETGRVDFTSGGKTVAVDPGYFSLAYEGKAPSVPAPHALNQLDNLQAGSSMKHTQQPASSGLLTQDAGRTVTTQREKAELILASAPGGLAQALMAVELTTLRESPLVELPAQALQALNFDGHLVKALTTLASLSNESLRGNVGGTTARQGTGQVSASVTVGGSTGATTAVTAAPVASATVTVAPVAAPVVAVVTPVVAPVVAFVAPVIAPVVAVVPVVPVIPIIPAILAIPPAVINGALHLLGH
ncbi:MAG: FecR family protein [Nitrospirota bacterium]